MYFEMNFTRIHHTILLWKQWYTSHNMAFKVYSLNSRLMLEVVYFIIWLWLYLLSWEEGRVRYYHLTFHMRKWRHEQKWLNETAHKKSIWDRAWYVCICVHVVCVYIYRETHTYMCIYMYFIYIYILQNEGEGNNFFLYKNIYTYYQKAN